MSDDETFVVNYAAVALGLIGLAICFAGLAMMALFQRFGIGFPFVGVGFVVFITTTMASAKTTGGFHGE